MTIFDAYPFVHFDAGNKNTNDVTILYMSKQLKMGVGKVILTYMSSVDNAVTPTANACCLPSAITAYTLSQGHVLHRIKFILEIYHNLDEIHIILKGYNNGSFLHCHHFCTL